MSDMAFGLDIGATSIKAVWLEGDRKSIKLKACLSGPAPAKGMWSESEFDQEEMAQTIRKLMNDAGISTNEVHVALSDNHVFTKVIDIPNISDKELEQAVYWEAEQYVPASLSTMTLRSQVLRRPDKNDAAGKMQVLLVAAPTSLVTKYQRVLELAGLSIQSMETEMLSVIRSLGTTDQSPTALVINIGALSTSIAIVQKDLIVFTYSIPVGGSAMNRAIATDFGFTANQAEEYKKTYGISDKNLGGKIGKAIEPILLAILVEVKKASIFYQEKYRNDAPITQILLSGGTAKLPGIDLFFVQNSGIETVTVNPWRMLNIRGVPAALQESSPEYTIAVGLALKDYEV